MTINSIYSLKDTAERNIALFVGSGISAAAPTSLPVASEFIESMLLLDWVLGDEKFPLSLDQITASKVRNIRFEYLLSIFKEWGKHDINLLLKQFADAEPNPCHMQIAELCRSGVISNIITTNFDCCIEKALSKKSVPFNVISKETDSLEKKLGVINLLKVHGTIEKQGDSYDSTSLAVTLDAFSSSLSQWKLRILSEIIQNHLVVFAGYSGSDSYDINPVLFSTTEKQFLWVAHETNNISASISPEISPILENSSFPEIITADTNVFLGGDSLQVRSKRFALVPTYNLDNLFHPSAFVGRVIEAVGEYADVLSYYQEVCSESDYSKYLMIELLDLNRYTAICYYETGNYEMAQLKLLSVKVNLLAYVDRIKNDGKTPLAFANHVLNDHLLLIEEESAMVAAALGNLSVAQEHLNTAYQCLQNLVNSEARVASIRTRLNMNLAAIVFQEELTNKPNLDLHVAAEIVLQMEGICNQKRREGDHYGLIIALNKLGYNLLLLGRNKDAYSTCFEIYSEYLKLRTPVIASLLELPVTVLAFLVCMCEKKNVAKKSMAIYLRHKSELKNEYESFIKHELLKRLDENLQDTVTRLRSDATACDYAERVLDEIETLSDFNLTGYLRQSEVYSAEELTRQAVKLFSDGHFDAASAINELIITMNPHYVDAYLNLSNVKWQQDDFEGCMEVLNIGLVIFPDNYKLLTNKANILNEMRRFSDALPIVKHALNMKEEDCIAWNVLGNSFHGMRLFTEAIKAYNNAIGLNPHFYIARSNLKNSEVALRRQNCGNKNI